MKWRVFHVIHPTFGFGTDPVWPTGYIEVVRLSAENAEDVFRVTNTIDSPWWKGNKGFFFLVLPPLRSTSVGDVAVDADGRVFRFEMVGVTEVTV